MPSADLVGYSNLALYSAMGVFTVSMLLFTTYLAALGPVRTERAASLRDRELVGAGGAARDGAEAGTGVISSFRSASPAGRRRAVQ